MNRFLRIAVFFAFLLCTPAVFGQAELGQMGCKSFLGRQGEYMCPTPEGYNACVKHLKQGTVSFCIQTGNAESAARKATPAEAKTKLLAKNCKQVAPMTYQCSDQSYGSGNGVGYLDCMAFKNGGSVGDCFKRPNLLELYADKIEAKFKGRMFGYSFVVAKRDQPSVERSGGSARLTQDAPSLNMSPNVRYSLASVSKTITGAAVMRLLTDKKLSVDTKIAGYLPWNWKPGPNIDSITFKELLTHSAGIRCGNINYGLDYAGLRQCIEKGVSLGDKGTMVNCNSFKVGSVGCYDNYDYALFRAIIPVVTGKLVKPALSTFNTAQSDKENGIFTSNVYIAYVNDNLFAPAGLTKQACRPQDGTSQGLVYKYAAPKSKGGDFGDQSLVCGSQGWFLSAKQLSAFFFTLNNTSKIVPSAVSEQMRSELFGFQGTGTFASPYGEIKRWWHGGFHPASMNPGEINTLVLRFSNGVELSVIINSDFTTTDFSFGKAVTDAMSEALAEK